MQYCTEMGISKFGLTAYAHFGARFVWVRSFIEPDCLKTMYHSAIYHSNLSDQSVLEIRVMIRVRLLLAFLTENKENEHLFFRECHGR